MLQKILTNLKTTGKHWIVFTGDSITSCEWVHPNWRDIVIYVLQSEVTTLLDGDWKTAEWGIKGFNFAYDGATTTDILDHIDDILLVKPQLVIGLMGGNDPVLGIGVNQSIQNISKIAEKTTISGAEIVWCNSTPAGVGSSKNDEYQPYARAFMKLPEIKRLSKIDMFSAYQDFSTERFFTFTSEENPVEGIKKGESERYMQETASGEKFPQY